MKGADEEPRSASLADLRLFARHQLAAATATASDFAAMIALVDLVGLSPPAATLLSAAAGGAINFGVSRAWAFSGRHDGSLRSQALRYAAVSAGCAVLNAAALSVVLRVADVPYALGRAAVALVVSVLFTYPLHARFVFRRAAETRAFTLPPRLARYGLALRLAPFVAYGVYALARGMLRVEQVVVIGFAGAMPYVGSRARNLFYGLYPAGLVLLLYDAMRPFQKVGLSPERVLSCDLRSFEVSVFGWRAGARGVTFHDWFQSHHAPVLDLLCAIPYATFLVWCVAGAVVLGRTSRALMTRFTWGFFVLNVAGFATYHLVPAAPPWYVHTHGCFVDLATKASEGAALARVDALLGVPLFRSIYGEASSVFGALPSLHCAYPLLLALVGYRAFSRPLKLFAFGYWIWMMFAAVYLDHHWVTDAVAGSLYAVVAAVLVGAGGGR